jgi:hypothetical protein
MKQSTVQVRYDSEQLEALRLFMAQKCLVLEAELQDYIGQLFDKHVNRQVKDFLLGKDAKKTGDG